MRIPSPFLKQFYVLRIKGKFWSCSTNKWKEKEKTTLTYCTINIMKLFYLKID